MLEVGIVNYMAMRVGVPADKAIEVVWIFRIGEHEDAALLKQHSDVVLC